MNIYIKGIEFKLIIEEKPNNKNTYYSLKYPNIIYMKCNKLTSNPDYIIKNILPRIEDKILRMYQKNLKLGEINNLDNKIDENHIHLLGKKYNLNISISDKNIIYLDFENIYVQSKIDDQKYIQKIIDTLYNDTLRQIVEDNISGIKSRFSIKYDIKFEYKRAKTYFGECFFKEKRIILSSFLAKYEIKYILSVIYHEIGHFFVHNHQDKFYDLLENVFPDYKETQKELRRIKYLEKY